MDKVERGAREIFNPEIQKDLLLLEEQEVQRTHLYLNTQ